MHWICSLLHCISCNVLLDVFRRLGPNAMRQWSYDAQALCVNGGSSALRCSQHCQETQPRPARAERRAASALPATACELRAVLGHAGEVSIPLLSHHLTQPELFRRRARSNGYGQCRSAIGGGARNCLRLEESVYKVAYKRLTGKPLTSEGGGVTAPALK